jgi:hypothetical protein
VNGKFLEWLKEKYASDELVKSRLSEDIDIVIWQ